MGIVVIWHKDTNYFVIMRKFLRFFNDYNHLIVDTATVRPSSE